MITVNQLALDELPPEVQTEVKAADRLEYRSFHCVQEVLGYVGNRIVFGMAGTMRILSKKFEATSYGSDTWQWSWMKGLWRIT